jgi:hypothetical protein
LTLVNLLFSWYRTSPDGRRMNATWSPTVTLPRVRQAPLPPTQCYLTVSGGELEEISPWQLALWPRSAVIPEILAGPLSACGPRLLRAYEFASNFITEQLNGGFLPGTPLVLTDLRMPNLRPIDGRPSAPLNAAAPSVDLSFAAPRHGIGSTTFVLRVGRSPELRLTSAWPLLRDHSLRGHFRTEYSVAPEAAAAVLAPLWTQTPAAAKPTGRAMRTAAPLFLALSRGILNELGVS